MSVALTANFLQNARGLTLKDGGGITWSINANTNEISAAGSGGGGSVLSSVGLSDASTAPIYTVGNSPLTANGTLTITLNNQNVNKVFAGPGSGPAAQPTFRSLVAADIPALSYVTSVGLADASASPIYTISGSPVGSSGTLTLTLATQAKNTVHAGPTSGVNAQPTFRALVAADLPANGVNPTASVGLSAVNGSASTWMRSDGAPALDQTIVPTWSGQHTFSANIVSQSLLYTFAGTIVSLANNTATTIKALSSATAGQVFIVNFANPSGSAPSNWSCTAIVSCGTASMNATTLQSGAVVSISASGFNIQVTQTSGAAATMNWSILRIL